MKSEFPTELVYGDPRAPDLRLISCGGLFDRGSQSYVETSWCGRRQSEQCALDLVTDVLTPRSWIELIKERLTPGQ